MILFDWWPYSLKSNWTIVQLVKFWSIGNSIHRSWIGQFSNCSDFDQSMIPLIKAELDTCPSKLNNCQIGRILIDRWPISLKPNWIHVQFVKIHPNWSEGSTSQNYCTCVNWTSDLYRHQGLTRRWIRQPIKSFCEHYFNSVKQISQHELSK